MDFSEYIPKSEIAGSYGRYVFNFFMNNQTISQYATEI